MDKQQQTQANMTADIKMSGTLLLVDDEDNILKSLRRLLRPEGYTIFTANSGKQGLEILANETVDIVISDMRMPEMDGAAFLEQVSQRWPDIIRILLTGFSDISSTVAAINKGAIYKYLSKPWEDNDITLSIRRALELKFSEKERRRLEKLTQRQNAELKELNATLEQKVQQRTREVSDALKALETTHESLKNSYTNSVKIFANLIEMRERSAAGHARRVADLAHRIAANMGMKKTDVQDVLFAGLLHDIGKIGLSDKVITKSFHNMDQAERLEVIKHPVIGQGVLMSLDALQGTAKLIRSHHERYDGKGFPDGLSADAIPLGARILAVANDYDALQIGTLWSQKMSAEEAQVYIHRHSGSYYDPNVVKVFESLEDTQLRKVNAEREYNLKTKDLRGGMVLSRDLLTNDGVLLLSKGHLLDERLIEKVQRFEKSLDCQFIVYVKR